MTKKSNIETVGARRQTFQTQPHSIRYLIIYVYIYVYIYIYICIYVTYMYIYRDDQDCWSTVEDFSNSAPLHSTSHNICIHICIHIYIYVYTYTYMYTYIHRAPRLSEHGGRLFKMSPTPFDIPRLCIHICIYIYVYIHRPPRLSEHDGRLFKLSPTPFDISYVNTPSMSPTPPPSPPPPPPRETLARLRTTTASTYSAERTRSTTGDVLQLLPVAVAVV